MSKLKLVGIKGHGRSWGRTVNFHKKKDDRSKNKTIGSRELKVNSVFPKHFGTL